MGPGFLPCALRSVGQAARISSVAISAIMYRMRYLLENDPANFRYMSLTMSRRNSFRGRGDLLSHGLRLQYHRR